MKQQTKRIMGGAILSLAVISVSGLALAHPGPHYGPPGYNGYNGYGPYGGWMQYQPPMRYGRWSYRDHDEDYPSGRFSEQFDLSRDQRDKVDDIYDDYRGKLRDLYQEMRDNRRDMHRQMRDQGFDPAGYEQLATRQGKLITEMITLRAKMKSEIMAVLDKDQQNRFKRYLDRVDDYDFLR